MAKYNIASHVKQCLEGFTHLGELLTAASAQWDNDLPIDEISGQSGRLRIWAGNIGAFQDGNLPTSLEYRLREAPRMITRIVDLLEDIQESLEDVSDIVSGERPNRVADSLSDESQNSEDSEGEVLTKSHEPKAVQKISELTELFQSVKESISGLFKISVLIRNATPRDRYAKAANSGEPFDPAYDIAHVCSKHPKLSTVENEWLANRLGQAITTRRQYLRYCRDHHNKLSAETIKPRLPKAEFEQRLPIRNATFETGAHFEDGASTIRTKPASTLAFTTASTLNPTGLDAEEEALDDSKSEFSDATSMADDATGNLLHVVEVEKASRGLHPFECPYCWGIVRTRRQRLWKRHVYHDLKPYVCTFAECDVKMLGDRQAWFSHELEAHRTELHCHFCSSRTFSTETTFHEHLRSKHAGKVNETQLPAITTVSRRPITRTPAKDCPLCDNWDETLRKANPQTGKDEVLTVTPSQFRHHLGNHLEQLALFAIPRGLETEEIEAGSDQADAGNAGEDVSQKSSPSIASIESNPKNDPVLHQAAYQGLDLEVVQMLEEGEDVNVTGDTWGTALHAAAFAGHVAIVDVLLDHGADIHAVGSLGTVLQTACRSGWKDVVSALIAKGADVGIEVMPSKAGRFATALQCAVFAGHESIVEMLIDHGANVNYRSRLSENPIHLAAAQGHYGVVEILIHHGARVDDGSEGGEDSMIAIELAAANGHLNVVELLLNSGASIRYSLQHAARAGQESIIERLLQASPNVDARTLQTGTTALTSAAKAGHAGAARLLLESGADVNSLDAQRDSPLHFAAASGHLEVAKLLLDHGASVRCHNSISRTPLYLSALYERVAMARYLIEEQEKRNLEETNLGTLLEVAIRTGVADMVQILLEVPYVEKLSEAQRAKFVLEASSAESPRILELIIAHRIDIDSRNELGATPLQTTASLGHETGVRRLIDQGADIKIVGPRGSALDHAAAAGRASLVELLLMKGAVVTPSTHKAAGGNEEIRRLLELDLMGLIAYREARTDLVRASDIQQSETRGLNREFNAALQDEAFDAPLQDEAQDVPRHTLHKQPKRQNTEDESTIRQIPEIKISVPGEQLKGYTSSYSAPNQNWSDQQITAEMTKMVLAATGYDDLGTRNVQEKFAIVDLINSGNARRFAPIAVQCTAQRFKEEYRHVQLKALSLVDTLFYNAGVLVRKEVANKAFCYALARLALRPTTHEEVRQNVVEMIADWLEKEEIFGGNEAENEVDPTFLQGALDTILNGHVEKRDEFEESLDQGIAIGSSSGDKLEDEVDSSEPPRPRRTPHPQPEIDPDILTARLRSVESQFQLRNDPFTNWSGKGRHVEFTDLSEVPLAIETSIFKTRRYNYNVVRWRSYILTRQTVRLDSRWTRRDAERAVSSMWELRHAHIMQVVGSYSLPNAFGLLGYPAANWTLEQFLELVERDLTNEGSNRNSITSSDTGSIGRFVTCMASAVQHVHLCGYRHGSLRARAWLVSSRGNSVGPFNIYLTGFDFAHEVGGPEEGEETTADPIETQESFPSGSRSLVSAYKGKYGAPDKIKTQASDTFSLGCIFIEMLVTLTGNPQTRRDLNTILRDESTNYDSYRLHIPQSIELVRSLYVPAGAHVSTTGLFESLSLDEEHIGRGPLLERMIAQDADERPGMDEVVAALGGTHSCCEAEPPEFEPDWFQASIATKEGGNVSGAGKNEAGPSETYLY